MDCSAALQVSRDGAHSLLCTVMLRDEARAAAVRNFGRCAPSQDWDQYQCAGRALEATG